MPAWVRLAVKIAAGLAVFVLLVGGGIWLALHQSGSAVEGRVENDRAIEQNAERISGNSEKINGTLRCLQRARDPRSCIDRVAGPQGPGGASGSTGRMGARGRRGLSVTGAQGPRGRPGVRGPQGLPGRPGRDGEDARPAVDGVNGMDGAPGRMGPPGPGPTDEQVQAAVNNYCDSHNQCAPTMTMTSPPVEPVPSP